MPMRTTWSQFATLNDLEEESETRRLGTGGAFDPRGEKVILDADLARIYGVETKAFNRAVKRNADRFPPDFVFQLSRKEFNSLRFQFGTLKTGRGQHRKYLPYAFTEHGAIMTANVLNSPQAVQMSVYVVRAFLKMRSVLSDSLIKVANFELGFPLSRSTGFY